MDSNGTVHQVKSVTNMGYFNLFQQLKGFQGAMIKVMKCVQNINSQIMDVQMCISVFLVLPKPNIPIISLFILLQLFQHHLNQSEELMHFAATLEKMF